MRQAPSCGYDVSAKRQYRREVWAFFARHCPVPMAVAQAFLMPSLEGDEIEVALSKGCREYNLHVCDRNPAVVATLKRRFPLVNTYGVEAGRAAARLPKLHLANVDLCSMITENSTAQTQAIASRLAPEGLIAWTFYRGRDPMTTDYLAMANTWGHVTERRDRAWIAHRLLGLEEPWRSGEYKTTSPMGWVVGRTAFAESQTYEQFLRRCPALPSFPDSLKAGVTVVLAAAMEELRRDAVLTRLDGYANLLHAKAWRRNVAHDFVKRLKQRAADYVENGRERRGTGWA